MAVIKTQKDIIEAEANYLKQHNANQDKKLVHKQSTIKKK